MVHDLAYNAIGLVYVTMFCHTFSHVNAARLWDRITQCSHEHYCHLALGILYPLSVAHLN